MPGMNSVSAKVDVGGSALEGAPTTLAGPSDLDTKKPPTRASLKMAEKARMAYVFPICIMLMHQCCLTSFFSFVLSLWVCYVLFK